MPLPFGIKTPSRGTVIFTSVVGTLGGSFFASKYYAQQSRQALCDKVSWLADRPCGVHEKPRKVQVFLTAPPGDGLEKARNWFGDYIKPVLVAAAIDYEVKEARQVGQIESVVRDQVIQRRRHGQQQQQQLSLSSSLPSIATPLEENDQLSSNQNPFASGMQDILKQQQEQSTENEFDGVIAVGRNAWREVLAGLDKGCTVSLAQVAREEAEAERQKILDEQKAEKDAAATKASESKDGHSDDSSSTAAEQSTELLMTEEQQHQEKEQEKDVLDNHSSFDEKDEFKVPGSLSPVMYIPHENIIGWTNIPYRLYMWLMDYQRIERFGDYVVDVALNKTRPLTVEDIDVGHQEKKYWIGDDEAKVARDQDQPIQLDDRVRVELKTYTK